MYIIEQISIIYAFNKNKNIAKVQQRIISILKIIKVIFETISNITVEFFAVPFTNLALASTYSYVTRVALTYYNIYLTISGFEQNVLSRIVMMCILFSYFHLLFFFSSQKWVTVHAIVREQRGKSAGASTSSETSNPKIVLIIFSLNSI